MNPFIRVKLTGNPLHYALTLALSAVTFAFLEVDGVGYGTGCCFGALCVSTLFTIIELPRQP